MAVFAYTALDRTGRRTAGTMSAESKAAAMDQVISQGLSPVSITEARAGAAAAAQAAQAAASGPRSTSTKVPQSAVESFTRELANLLGASLPLSRALHLLRREVSHPGAKNVWSAVHDDVVGGVSLAEAM
jgi:general secretion pathway protein F